MSPSGVGGGSTRWCPTPEQLMILEEMYTGGVKTPTAAQIQQITAHLSRYGKIEGKNVFYWFQNHKARDRQKLRRRLAKHLLMMSGNFHNYPHHHQQQISNYHQHRHSQQLVTSYNHNNHYQNHHYSLTPPPPPSCCQPTLQLPPPPPPPPHDLFLSPISSSYNNVPNQGYNNLGSTNFHVNSMGTTSTTSTSNSPVMIRYNNNSHSHHHQQQLAYNYNHCPLPPPTADSFVKYYSKGRDQQQEEAPVSSADQFIRTSGGYESVTSKLEKPVDVQNTMMMMTTTIKDMKTPDTYTDDHRHDWMIITHHDSAGDARPLQTLQLFPTTPAKD